jgi:prephenate dehydrogenase
VAAARADLFQQAICVVTPTAQTPTRVIGRIERLWREVGSCVLRLSPAEHDLLVSRSSHLPHVLAAALTNLVLDSKQGKNQGRLCATGFRDTTRIASGSPEMWRDIALANRRNLSKVLADLAKSLEGFSRAIEQQDEQAIHQFFERARSLREAWASGCKLQSPE